MSAAVAAAVGAMASLAGLLVGALACWAGRRLTGRRKP